MFESENQIELRLRDYDKIYYDPRFHFIKIIFEGSFNNEPKRSKPTGKKLQ